MRQEFFARQAGLAAEETDPLDHRPTLLTMLEVIEKAPIE
jgi:hypothetical protein